MESRCEVPGCREEESCLFYDRRVCDRHHREHCDDDSKFDLKVLFGIKDEPPKAVRRKAWAARLAAMESVKSNEPELEVSSEEPELETQEEISVKNGKPKRAVGKISGLGYHATWVKHLEDGFAKKLDDVKIMERMRSEFPGKPMCTVGTARGNYNRGLFHVEEGKLRPPTKQLSRHGDAPRRGKAPAPTPKKKVVVVVKKPTVAAKKPATVKA